MGRKDRDRDYRKRKRYDDDDYDDDDYKRHQPRHTQTTVERIITPGSAANNFIKATATGVIAGGALLLMVVYGIFGDRLAGSQYLPLATAVSSAVTTACIWIFGRPKVEKMHNEEIHALKSQIADLNLTVEEMQDHFALIDKRLTDAEYIEDFEERLARKEITSRKLSSDIPVSNEPISTPSTASTNMPGLGGQNRTSN